MADEYNIHKLLRSGLTFPTILYLLLKNLYQSFRTVFFSSGRSYQSGTHSSAFRLEEARARLGSFPAKTAYAPPGW